MFILFLELSRWFEYDRQRVLICVFGFGTRVFDDEEEWFRSIFASSTKEDAIRNQYEFFVQRMGGPPLFSRRKGKIKSFIGLMKL